jgi:phosphoserine aminotransferase
MTGSHPAVRPARPFFSSGPCAKRPGWTSAVLDTALLGRSHRSGPGRAKLKGAIDRTRKLLGAPDAFRCAIVPASDTGAVEIAMWSMLGPRPVDVFAWESFGEDWVTDAVKQLKIEGARAITAPYGALPDLSQADPAHDIVFTWNGTTGGVRVPNADWIAAGREGIVICDATSAAFAMDLDWDKLDVVTFSWQKVLGGEAAHGMMLLSPRAVARLESFAAPRPLPKLFRLTKGGKLNEAIFQGETINTPSMLALEDYLDALGWAESIGGFAELKRRVAGNCAALSRWVEETGWINFLCPDEAIRSPTSVCLKIVDPVFAGLGEEAQYDRVKRIAGVLEAEAVAFDVAGHRNAPPGLRIWCGATVETGEIEALTPWLDWAFKETRA